MKTPITHSASPAILSLFMTILFVASPQLATAAHSANGSGTSHATQTTPQGLVTDPDVVIPMPNMSKPGYLQPDTDPNFNTVITRITGDEGDTYTDLYGNQYQWGQHSIHHYSTIQPWNSDGSLIEMQVSDGPSVVLLDGNTYQPKYGKCDNYGYRYDTRWHPAPGHENEQINVKDGYLYWFNVVTCDEVLKIKLPATSDARYPMTYIGGGKGNVSADGRYVVLVDHDYPDETHPKMYLLDMLGTADNGSQGRFGPPMDVPAEDAACGDTERGCELSWAGLSPSGKYAIAHYHHDYTRVYDIDYDTLSFSVRPMPADSLECPPDVDGKPPKSAADGFIFDTGHEDMTIDPEDGEDVVVGIRRGWCKNDAQGNELGQVVMVRLKDNKVTSLTNPDNEEYGYHVSARNTKLPGWVYVTYRNPADGRDWERFTDEVVAISLASRPGHQIVRRLAHTHNTGKPYENEAHAVPSPDGKRVLFASAWDWGCDSDQGDQGCGEPRADSNSVQDYLIDLRPLLASCPDANGDGIFCDGFETDEPAMHQGY